MPNKARKYCKHPRCTNYAEDGSAYCFMHKNMHNHRVLKEYETWYYRAVWKKLRARKLREYPLCQECAKRSRVTKATDVDHIVPHKGSWLRFIDYTNLQALCHSCHSIKTNKEMESNDLYNGNK